MKAKKVKLTKTGSGTLAARVREIGRGGPKDKPFRYKSNEF